MGENRSVFRYAVLGGIISGATIGLPVLDLLNCACCAGVMLGGFLAVFFAVKDQGNLEPRLSKSDALQLGVLSGIVGAVVGTILHAMMLAVAGDVVIQIFSSVFEDPDVRNSLPGPFVEALDELFQSQGEVSFIDLLGHLFLWLILAPLFGLAGGLIGYSLLQKKSDLPPSFPPPSEMTT